MFEKEIEELFRLSMRVINETNCFVRYSIAARTSAIYVDVSDKWESDFYRNNREMIDLHKKLSAEEKAAKDSIEKWL